MFEKFYKSWCLVHFKKNEVSGSLSLSQALKDYEYCEVHNIRCIDSSDPIFPQFLKNPNIDLKAFYFKGDPCWLERDSINVVGSRNPSSLSVQWMEDFLMDFLKSKDLNVVSGGARGIDQRAHALALRVGRPTLAFLPSGLKSIYPKEFSKWVEPIVAQGGAVISGFPLDSLMYKSYFHRRNRWMAQISLFTFMVEGRRRSGSALTAMKALELGRPVCCIPQSPYSSAQAFMDIYEMGGRLIRDTMDLELIYGEAKSKQPLFETV